MNCPLAVISISEAGQGHLSWQCAENPSCLPTPDTCVLDGSSLTRLGACAEGGGGETSMPADAGRAICAHLSMVNLARPVFKATTNLQGRETRARGPK